MRRDLLKENVDGEALLWAARRLRDRPEKRKLLLAISDGAPVDDSTLSANGPDYLDRHVKDVVAAIHREKDFRIAGIGLDHELSHYYPESIVVRSKDDLQNQVVPFVAKLLIGGLDMPGEQAPTDPSADGC
jgi:cobaltochelatase CobT